MPDDKATVLTTEPTTSDAAADTKASAADSATTKAPDSKVVDTKVAPTKTEAPEQVVPETYNLKLPKDSPLTEAELADTADLAKTLGLSQDKAQALLEKRHNDRASFIEGQQQFLKDQVKAWEAATTSDVEIAGKDGADFKQNIAYARNIIGKFGSPQMVKALNDTGLGNHPELVRMMVRIGKAMKEDPFQTGSETKGSETGDLESRAAKKFFKSTTKE